MEVDISETPEFWFQEQENQKLLSSQEFYESKKKAKIFFASPKSESSEESKSSQQQQLLQSRHSSQQRIQNPYSEIAELKQTIETLKSQIQKNKIFMYMVIHDLKHPTESMINQLGNLQAQLENHLVSLDQLLNRSANIQQTLNILQQKKKQKKVRIQKSKRSQSVLQNHQNLQGPNFSLKEADLMSSENPHHNVPKFQKLSNPSKFDTELNSQNRQKRQQKVEMLSAELDEFFRTHIQTLGYLVDGNLYNLQLSIQCSEDQQNCIRTVSTTLQNEASKSNSSVPKDILPRLKSLSQKLQPPEEIEEQVVIDTLVTDIQEALANVETRSAEIEIQNETVKMMLFSSQIMRNLMMDLLDLAQMENSTFKLNKSFFSLYDMVNSAFGIVSHIAESKQVQLEFSPPINEQEGVYYSAIFGDQSRFLQVLLNFLSNSLKFSDRNSKVVVYLKMLEQQILTSDKDIKKLVSQTIQKCDEQNYRYAINSASVVMKCNNFSNEHRKNMQSKSLNDPLMVSLEKINIVEIIKNMEQNLIEENKQLNSAQIIDSAHQEDGKQYKEFLQKEITDNEYEGKTCYIKFELGIQDFGCGIPSDKLDDLFINFNNLEQHRKKNPSGRGLGLSICKMIVESMGGTVKVQSEVGKGSIFSIIFKVMCKVPELVNVQDISKSEILFSRRAQSNIVLNQFSPLNESRKNHTGQMMSQIGFNNSSLSPRNHKKYLILLVNDDPFLLWSYKEQLQCFFNVTTAENGFQAVQIVHSHPQHYFDAIILDINMPIMNGYEACERIYKYLTNSNDEFIISQSSQQLFQKSPLIYALTSDCSEECYDEVRKYPFTAKFDRLNIEIEIVAIIEEISRNVLKIPAQVIQDEVIEEIILIHKEQSMELNPNMSFSISKD